MGLVVPAGSLGCHVHSATVPAREGPGGGDPVGFPYQRSPTPWWTRYRGPDGHGHEPSFDGTVGTLVRLWICWNQSSALCDAHRVGAPVRFELAVDRHYVELDGALADPELVADLLV